MCANLKYSVWQARGMTGHDWKSTLKHAETTPERIKAIRRAISLGAIIHDVEQYLDYLDSRRFREGDQS